MRWTWNNGASLHLAEILGHEYLDETYAVIDTALGFFRNIKAENQKRSIKISEWKAFANILYAAHLAACDRDKVEPEMSLEDCFSHVNREPAIIVEVLTDAIKTITIKQKGEAGEENA